MVKHNAQLCPWQKSLYMWTLPWPFEVNNQKRPINTAQIDCQTLFDNNVCNCMILLKFQMFIRNTNAARLIMTVSTSDHDILRLLSQAWTCHCPHCYICLVDNATQWTPDHGTPWQLGPVRKSVSQYIFFILNGHLASVKRGTYDRKQPPRLCILPVFYLGANIEQRQEIPAKENVDFA